MVVGSNGDGGDEDEDDARSCFDEDEDDTQGALLLRPARRHTLHRASVSSFASGSGLATKLVLRPSDRGRKGRPGVRSS